MYQTRLALTQACNTSVTSVFIGIHAGAPKQNNKSLQYAIGIIELVNRHMEGKHLLVHLLIITQPSPLEINIHNILRFTQLAAVHKQNTTKWEKTQQGRKSDSNCHNLFCFTQALHTNKIAYPSRNTVALNSCFFQVVYKKRLCGLFPVVKCVCVRTQGVLGVVALHSGGDGFVLVSVVRMCVHLY